MNLRKGVALAVVAALSILGNAGPTLGVSPVCPFTVIGIDEVVLDQRAEVIGAVASLGTVTAGKGSKTIDPPPNIAASGDTVVLGESALIDGNVKANQVSVGKNAVITGTATPPPTPLGPLPTVSVSPGTTAVTVPKGGELVFAPGAYLSLLTGEGATIHFTGGQYDLAEMTIRKGTNLIFEGPTVLNVRDRVETGEDVAFTATGGLTAGDIQLNYAGTGDVLFGTRTHGTVSVVAPNGRIMLGSQGVYSGQFGARRVQVGKETRIEKGPCAPPPGSCTPSNSLTVLVDGTNVTAYVPKGSWSFGTTGVSVVNVEGSSIVPTLIPTVEIVNTCAANFTTRQVVCTGNDTDVYLISGTAIDTTLTSGGTGSINFSGGTCTTCGVAMDATHNRAVIALSVGGVGGYQVLDLSGVPTLQPPFASQAPLGVEANISENILIDPFRNLILSPNENNNYELVDITDPSNPLFFEQAISGLSGILDSAGADCSTGIALAPAEFSAPSQIYLADLTQATFVAGAPGSWTSAGAQVQTLTESVLSAGASGIAVAQGKSTGIVTGEFGGDAITAIALPTTSGTGTPAITDWVTCNIGQGFSNGFDPHTVTAYQSPNPPNDAIALLSNGAATVLAVVNLTKMLDPAIVPRTVGPGLGHACATSPLPSSVVSFIPVP